MIRTYVALNFYFFIVALENMSSQLTIEGIVWYCGEKIKLSYLYFQLFINQVIAQNFKIFLYHSITETSYDKISNCLNELSKANDGAVGDINASTFQGNWHSLVVHNKMHLFLCIYLIQCFVRSCQTMQHCPQELMFYFCILI